MGRFSAGTLRDWSELSESSARVVLPLVFELARPASVVDVGCLFGAWADECRRLGADDVLGIDGDYVDRAALAIPFVARDLMRPLRLERGFDLAICLEVAHYLPEGRAESFVRDLCLLAPMVLFSAAIPFQGGLHHLNEQWPEYWAERFAKHGYAPVDCIRDAVWDDAHVARWYAQNTLLFVADGAPLSVANHPGYGRCPARVHPEQYLTYAAGRYQALRRRVAGAIG
jgi:SAM-dependent methyltransferase